MESIKNVSIKDQMQGAYLDYAMSVIVSRALPDVRDGLKPVHRRILYAMFDMGLRHDRPYRKSARIVGEVLGKYHPHGDTAVYDAMVRMAQDFSMRYLLVDGQGNFGSIDGDAAAAMRYTEARMHILAEEMLADINKDTVDFSPNFDDSLKEPVVLPTQVPNLLINGASGIAVGMATNIPPHNLSEVCDGMIYMLSHYDNADEVAVDDLMRFVKGPDFPTGGVIYRYREDKGGGKADMIRSAYAMGRGRIVMQGVTHIEEMSRNRHRLVVTELPYMVNKARLIEKIADLARNDKIEGIVDLRDESDRQGIRICIEMTRTVDPMVVLDRLMKLTPLRSTFGVIMLALVDGEPRTLPLKKVMLYYIDHRREVIRRRTEYDLARAKARAHIIEGLLIALDNIDRVIQIIRHSRYVRTAREKLMKEFSLSEEQAQAILDMPLRRLAGMERRQLEEEAEELRKLIVYLESLLADPALILAEIKKELIELKKRYGDKRRTQIIGDIPSQLTDEDLLPDEPALVAVNRTGEMGRTAVSDGVIGEWDYWLDSHTRQQLIAITTNGRALWTPVHQISVMDRKGSSSSSIGQDKLSLVRGEKVVAIVSTPSEAEKEKRALAIATRRGKIKRIALADLLSRRSDESEVIGLDKGDSVVGAVVATEDEAEVIMANTAGKVIRFAMEDVRVMGLAAGGVIGMRLGKRDEVVSLQRVHRDMYLLTVSERGYTKRTDLSEFSTQGRGGNGVIGARLSKKTGAIVSALVANTDQVIQVITAKGWYHKVDVDNVVEVGRATMGQVVVELDDEDQIVLARVLRNEDMGWTAVADGGVRDWDTWLVSQPHQQLVAITTHGRAVRGMVQQISELDLNGATSGAEGQGELSLLPAEKIVAIIPVVEEVEEENRALAIATKRGKIKRIALADVLTSSSEVSEVMGLDEDDVVIGAVVATEDDVEVLLTSNAGQVIRFAVEDVRVMGLSAGGVIGIRLEKKDEVISVQRARKGAYLVTISERGYTKRTDLSEYPSQGRGGKGVIGVRKSKKTGPILAALVADIDQVIQVFSAKGGQHQGVVNDVVEMSRATMGQTIMNIAKNDKIVLARVSSVA